jgi:hypothetical protein
MVTEIVGPITTGELKSLFFRLAMIQAIREYDPKIIMRAGNKKKRDRA